MTKVIVEFEIRNRDKFNDDLKRCFENDDNVPGMRTDLTLSPDSINVFMPKELQTIAPVIHRFFDACLYKLRKNAHKGSLEELDLEQSLKKLREETEELSKAIAEGNQIEVLLEAGDVANFAMILASIAIEGRKRT